MLEKQSIELLVYSIETVLAEKLKITPRGRLNTRMRDLYDSFVKRSIHTPHPVLEKRDRQWLPVIKSWKRSFNTHPWYPWHKRSATKVKARTIQIPSTNYRRETSKYTHIWRFLNMGASLVDIKPSEALRFRRYYTPLLARLAGRHPIYREVMKPSLCS